MAVFNITYLPTAGDHDHPALSDSEFSAVPNAPSNTQAMARSRPFSTTPFAQPSSTLDTAYQDGVQGLELPEKTASEWYSGSSSGRSTSQSPHTASIVYTPESPFEIFEDQITDHDARPHDEEDTDPVSHISPVSGSYVFVDSSSSASHGDHHVAANERTPQPSSWLTPADPVSSSPAHLASLTPPHRSWSSLASSSSSEWMDIDRANPPNSAGAHMDNDLSLEDFATGAYDADFLTNFTDLDHVASQGLHSNQPVYGSNLAHQVSSPLHRHHDHIDSFNSTDIASRVHHNVALTDLFQQNHSALLQTIARGPPTTYGYVQVGSDPLPGYVGQIPTSQMPSSSSSSSSSRNQSASALHNSRSAPLPSEPQRDFVDPLTARTQSHQAQHIHDHANTTSSHAHKRPIQPAGPGQNVPTPSPQDRAIARRGGRRTRLTEPTRLKSSKMRKTSACWACTFQRGPCPDEGTPCGRCIAKNQKGMLNGLACERTKLPDLVLDFLPPSMTFMHQKQSIEDCVTDQVLRWDELNCINIRFTCGYGPPLEWRVYEFVPRTGELLGQFQYRQDKQGKTRRLTKYSPPFGLLHLDTSDSIRAESYLDRALQPKFLHDFGLTCFEEESQSNYFQGLMLQSICNLYMKTADDDLHLLLQKIIRMMAITYIMGHTLTIEESDYFSVIGSIQHTGVPPGQQPFTSPRLANRQLKFFFSILRGVIYDNILNWLHQTLHSSSKRESTWLPAFCVMLGFAMVLEEAQHTIILQADAKIQKGEMAAEAATKEAKNACQRIDDCYTFLVRLFQTKYRDNRWTTGSFGRGTPELKDPHARAFLQELYQSLVNNVSHLQARREVQFKPEHQSIYTSRLVARFLLPFLGLPP